MRPPLSCSHCKGDMTVESELQYVMCKFKLVKKKGKNQLSRYDCQVSSYHQQLTALLRKKDITFAKVKLGLISIST